MHLSGMKTGQMFLKIELTIVKARIRLKLRDRMESRRAA
jgi:hypothetical protein